MSIGGRLCDAQTAAGDQLIKLVCLPSTGLLQDQEVATEALQVSCLLLPPPNRRRLQLLLRLMARVCQNPLLPPLNDFISTRTLVQLCTSACIDDAVCA